MWVMAGPRPSPRDAVKTGLYACSLGRIARSTHRSMMMYIDDMSEAERFRSLADLYYRLVRESDDGERRKMLLSLARSAAKRASTLESMAWKGEPGHR